MESSGLSRLSSICGELVEDPVDAYNLRALGTFFRKLPTDGSLNEAFEVYENGYRILYPDKIKPLRKFLISLSQRVGEKAVVSRIKPEDLAGVSPSVRKVVEGLEADSSWEKASPSAAVSGRAPFMGRPELDRELLDEIRFYIQQGCDQTEQPWKDEGIREATLLELLRTVHRTKGAASLGGLVKMQDSCHRLETLIEDVRSRKDQYEQIRAREFLYQLLSYLDDYVLGLRRDPGRTDDLPAATLLRIDQSIGLVLKDPAYLVAIKRYLDEFRVRLPVPTVRLPIEKIEGLAAALDEIERLILEGRGKETTTAVLQRIAKERMRLQAWLKLPVSELFRKYPRMVNKIASDQGKKVRIETTGDDLHVHRIILETLANPLIHIMGNAIDHGIEAPEERIRKGKPEVGRLHLFARQDDEGIVIGIADDGRGLDFDDLWTRVERQNVDLDARQRFQQNPTEMVFYPGITTTDTPGKISGRGLGLDLVKQSVEVIHGEIELESEKDKGVEIRFRFRERDLVNQQVRP